MAVINTNSLSLLTQNNLNKSQSSLGTAIERLSSGLRINSAKDDAAGQAIANRFTSNINGLTVASRNANDGISLSQTAEGALGEINNNLQRIRDLTVQAQNSSNSASDIDSIQSEVNQRMEEISRVTKETDFNGIKVLSNAASKTFDFQVGSKDGEKIGITLEKSSGWDLASTTTASGVSALNTASTDSANMVINGTNRQVAAKGFDVLLGQINANGSNKAGATIAAGVSDKSSTALSDIDAALKAVD
ncbi:flagellin FliC, partial [Yersinia enterocolitica]